MTDKVHPQQRPACVCVQCVQMVVHLRFLVSFQQLFQKLKNLMRPYSVEFESPLELSAQGGSQKHPTLKPGLSIQKVSNWNLPLNVATNTTQLIQLQFVNVNGQKCGV